jgi:hypothetical protein
MVAITSIFAAVALPACQGYTECALTAKQS